MTSQSHGNPYLIKLIKSASSVNVFINFQILSTTKKKIEKQL